MDRICARGPRLQTENARCSCVFWDHFLSTGEIYILQPSLGLGCLDIIGSSAGTHGHGKARGDAPTRINSKTGRSLNLGPLDPRYPQTVFAPGRASKWVSGPDVWAVWHEFYTHTRKYPREGPSTRLDPRFRPFLVLKVKYHDQP